MKKWKQTMKKVGALVLALAMVVTMVSFPERAEAATMTGGEVLYLKPATGWKADNARFAIYVFGTGNAWQSMTDSDGDGIYEATVPKGNWTNVVFCRMNPNSSNNNWDNKWNQSGDIVYDGYNNVCEMPNWYDSWGVTEEGKCTWYHKHVDSDSDEICDVCNKCVDDDCSDASNPADGYCDECNSIVSIVDGIGAKLAGYTLSLDGNIGVNFYMKLSDDVLANRTAKMVFTLKNGKTQEIDVESIQPTVLGEENYYVFKCEVAAKEMADEIKAQIYMNGEKQGTEYTFSVEDYAKHIFEHKENPAYAAAEPLVKAMLNYGAYSQTFFGYNTENLANRSLLQEDQLLSDVQTSEFSDYLGNVEGKTSGVGTFEIANLALETTTAVNVLFKVDEAYGVEDLTFTVGEEEVEPVIQKVGDETYYRISKENIIFSDLENTYEFSVFDKKDNTIKSTITYGAFTYANSILSDTQDKHSDKMKNVIRALWKLYQVAETY